MTLRILQMKNSLRQIDGNWDLGFVLDKHKISSTPTGYNDYGHMQFDTIRTEVGEALFKLKYRNDSSQIQPLAEELANTIFPKFDKVGMLIPMPSSKKRPQQPVTELTKSIGKIVGKPVFEDILVKGINSDQLKNLKLKGEKLEALEECFTVNDSIDNEGRWNVLMIDDLFDTGASMETACAALEL
jgi:predicted amidophosphoribosyltransferase